MLSIFSCSLLLALHPYSYAETNVSVFAGYHAGGEFEDVNTGQRLKLDDDESYGISMSLPYSQNTKLEFVLSHQESRLLNDSAPAEVLIDLDIDYLHVGGCIPGPVHKPSPISSGHWVRRIIVRVAEAYR